MGLTDVERSVCASLESQRDQLVALASSLVGFDTTARNPGDPPRQEVRLQEHLAARLRATGAKIDLFEPDAQGGQAPSPLRYVEVDWKTEGLPRGPNNSFVSPHFDFTTTSARRVVDARTMCTSSNGRTCDPVRTSHAQMRRFLCMPASSFIPASYAPDVGSSIPWMGLHLLDRTFRYTVNVDHSATVLYGTFDGDVCSPKRP